jgi:hypothetical protein
MAESPRLLSVNKIFVPSFQYLKTSDWPGHSADGRANTKSSDRPTTTNTLLISLAGAVWRHYRPRAARISSPASGLSFAAGMHRRRHSRFGEFDWCGFPKNSMGLNGSSIAVEV